MLCRPSRLPSSRCCMPTSRLRHQRRWETVPHHVRPARPRQCLRRRLAKRSSRRDGYRSSAQALAGNIFDTLLRDATRRGVIFTGPPAGYFKYDKVRKQITPVSDDTVIRRFRADCVLSALLPAPAVAPATMLHPTGMPSR